jgi:hypothetical protein
MLAGFALAVVTYFPLFQDITQLANPKLEHVLAPVTVTVTADPSKCSFQFKARGTEKFTTGCDIIKSTPRASFFFIHWRERRAGSNAERPAGAACWPDSIFVIFRIGATMELGRSGRRPLS